MKYAFFALRPQQWVKNFFIFLPLVFGKKLAVFPYNANTLLAFFAFSLASSAAYLINDIIDVDKDRLHPTKCLRPIASGKIKIKDAYLMAFILACISVLLSFAIKPCLGYLVMFYLMANILYSKVLKKIVLVDTFCIGGFFLIRIAVGSMASDVVMSHWIIFMTFLLALFLGLNKRRQELSLLGKKMARHRSVLLEYSEYFIDQMISVIISSIVVVYMLYTIDARTVKEFGTDHFIYTVPFVYYGIFRYLYIIHKLRKDGDPTRILFFDKSMQINLALWLIVCIGIIYFAL